MAYPLENGDTTDAYFECVYCGAGLEFEASNYEASQILTAECPHCHRETSIGITAGRHRIEQFNKYCSRFTGVWLSGFMRTTSLDLRERILASYYNVIFLRKRGVDF